ncbi:hypothetical protein EXU57_00250 [Segetibacter sp. 3557_3]|uniref:hypothetical protein n=1 Tax=Segetibacter sp. 3557_3 TaxID=2547429 RepID=UPI001058B27A|nr:hypothetical protein [Segetibacter sp. 3557_3]TDH28545.1 hypothetical protein EXU57_00250 [Segetibacter sp. 3557_3]
MKYIYLSIITIAFVLTSGKTHAQTSQKPLDSLPAAVKTSNSGFDVIILHNGEILHGLVKELGLQVIKYQRTDIPDGPVYTIPRIDVYAISYRNQVKEYMSPVMVEPNNQLRNKVDARRDRWNDYPINREVLLFKENSFRIGVGFISGYTKVAKADNYAKTSASPVIALAYDTRYRTDLRLGLQMAFGSQKFSKQEFSTYDSIQSVSNLKENIFTFSLYGKYSSKASYANLRPYVILGLGINTSNVRTESELKLTSNQTLLVSSGSRSAGLGILARVGADYFFGGPYGLFADVGAGASLIQLGAIINLQ